MGKCLLEKRELDRQWNLFTPKCGIGGGKILFATRSAGYANLFLGKINSMAQ